MRSNRKMNVTIDGNRLNNSTMLNSMRATCITETPSTLIQNFSKEKANKSIEFSKSTVSPEVAAQIVRNYLLPMFHKKKTSKDKTIVGDLELNQELYGKLKMAEDELSDC